MIALCLEYPLYRFFNTRHGGQQLFGVSVLRIFQHLFRGALFDDFSLIHDGDMVRGPSFPVSRPCIGG